MTCKCEVAQAWPCGSRRPCWQGTLRKENTGVELTSAVGWAGSSPSMDNLRKVIDVQECPRSRPASHSKLSVKLPYA